MSIGKKVELWGQAPPSVEYDAERGGAGEKAGRQSRIVAMGGIGSDKDGVDPAAPAVNEAFGVGIAQPNGSVG